MNLRKFMFNLLPVYFKENDSYKVNGRGILERYLDTLGDELQEEMVDKLHDLINQLDPETATSEYLSLLAYTIGSPPDITGDLETYRKQVTQAIALYKYKGTKRGYDLLFALFGFNVEVNIITPPNYNYDTGIRYDSGPKYDLTKCNTHCIEYDLIYSLPQGGAYPGGDGVFTQEFSDEFDNSDGGEPLTEEMKEALIRFIARDFEPINAKLRNIIYDPYPSGVGVFSGQFNYIYR